MYIIEDRGIINLTLYPRFNILERNNVYQLCAFTNLETDNQIEQNDNFRKEGLTLMAFENEVDAEYALWHLFASFKNRITTWDTDEIKKPSEIWETIKKEYANEQYIPELLLETVLSVSGVQEIVIGYNQSIVTHRYITDQDMHPISKGLKNALQVPPIATIKVRWEAFDETQ